jgi:hypothetical protein
MDWWVDEEWAANPFNWLLFIIFVVTVFLLFRHIIRKK